MSETLIALQYLATSEANMLALDAERREAESAPEDADWNGLARRYEEQGRPAMAAKCRGRAQHYAQVYAVPDGAVEYA
jgi:hypothetical protein